MKQSYYFLFIFFLVCFTSKLYSQSVPSYVPTNGLVGWWGFNGNAQDGSGNGNHGTVNGATLTTDRFGNQNGAYNFNGVNFNHISIPSDSILDLINDFTISCWFYSNSMYSQPGTVRSILMKSGDGVGDPNGYVYGLWGGFPGTSNQIGMINFSAQPYINSLTFPSGNSGFVSINNWYHFLVTYEINSSTLNYYLNNNLIDTKILSFNIGYNSNNLWIGSQPSIYSTIKTFDGNLDDIGIWNRVLTQQEITNLYNAQNPQPCTTSIPNNINISGCGFAVLSSGDTVNQSGTYIDTLLNSMGCDSILNQLVTIQNPSICNPIPSYIPTNGLVGWWGFNGNAQDGSGNGNHGTVNGATLTTDRFGLIANAYYLNGVSDYLSVPVLNNSLLPQNLTVSTWCQIPSNYTANNHIGMMVRSRFFGYILLYDDNNQSIRFETFTNGTATPTGCASNGTDYSDNVWHHIVGTFDGSINKLYIDGNLISSIISTHPISYSSDGIIAFGRDGNNPSLSTALYQGKLDDIGIWNRALTQQEITNLYNSQLPTQTSLCLPTITTNTPTSIGIDSVVVGGDILNDGGSTIVLRGVCYSTTPNPNMGNPRTEEGSGIGSFTSTLRNLSPSTTYYARSYAKNSQGVVVYGNEVSFSTGTPIPGTRCPGTPSVTDIDGNMYHTVQIGNQCWMQSNLQSSRYRNGDPIPTGLSYTDWASTTSGSYATHYISGQIDSIEKKYNYFAVVDSRGLCPTGWHVSTDSEWNTLVKFLDINADTISFPSNQSTSAGGMLKNTLMWNICPSNVANNISGFSAVTTGMIHSGGGYMHVCRSHHWTSSNFDQTNAIYRYMEYYLAEINRFPISTNSGLSVRCLKDIVPTVSTTTVSNVTATSATTGGDVTKDGGTPVTARGVAYGTSATPTTSGTITTDGTGTGVFTSTLTGLMPSTTYYVRAYATNSVGTAYGNEVSFTTAPLSIGSSYAGGIVFDLDSTGQHGLVCAPSDQGAYEWGCYGTDISNTSTAVGTGATNTAYILAGCSQRPIAASVCADLVLNGYSDWYLPSIGELQLMYSRLHLQGLGGFGGSDYWSSSQASLDYAWFMAFYVGAVSDGYPTWTKGSSFQVRAVRAF